MPPIHEQGRPPTSTPPPTGASRSEAEREAFVRLHLPLAEHLAHRFANRGIPIDDLVQVASLALVHAVDRYDPTHGTTFATFASPTIVGEIKRHFRDRSWDLRVPRRVKDLYLEINDVVGRLSQQLARSPSIAEVAAATRSTEEEVLEAMEAGQAFQTHTLESTERGLTRGLEPDLPDALAEHDTNLRDADDRLLVEDLLSSLPPRERLLVRLRFFDGMTQHDIAVRLGVSQMHVSRLLARTIEFLREHPGLQDEL